MEAFMKADIFFFITSIAVVIVTIGVLCALFYLLRILRNVRDVTDRVEEGTKALVEDVATLRSNLRGQGFAWGSLFAFLRKHPRWFSSKKGKAKTE